MNKYFYFSLVIFFCWGCHKVNYKWNYGDGTVGLHKNYKFYDGQYIDSVFYFLYLGDDTKGLHNKYIDEDIQPLKLNNSEDKVAIERFLYSLEVYNTLFGFGKKKTIVLTRKHFFQNRTFAKNYRMSLEGGIIELKNLQDLNDYNFGGFVNYDTIGSSIHIHFPPSKCELICPINLFEEGIYFTRLNNIVVPQQYLAIPNIYLKKIGWD